MGWKSSYTHGREIDPREDAYYLLLDGQFPPAFRAAAGKDTSAGRRGLAHQKTMGGFALLLFGAIGK
jgi:hypothetical protein